MTTDPEEHLKDLLRKFCRLRLAVARIERRVATLKSHPDPAWIDETFIRAAEKELTERKRECEQAFEDVSW